MHKRLNLEFRNLRSIFQRTHFLSIARSHDKPKLYYISTTYNEDFSLLSCGLVNSHDKLSILYLHLHATNSHQHGQVVPYHKRLPPIE